MPKSYYLPVDDIGKAKMIAHLLAKLPNHVQTLGIAPPTLASLAADSNCLNFVLQGQEQAQSNAQQWTALKYIMRDGGAGTVTIPAPLSLPTPTPAMVEPGIIGRVTALVAHIKTHPNYTEAIGQDLGIVGAERVVDRKSLKPELGVELRAGRPVVLWTKGDADALEVWADHGDGKGFVFFEVDTRPPCPDPTPLPAPGVIAVWQYRAMYRLRDERVGQWSETVSITVRG